MSGLLREGHWRTTCIRTTLHLLDVIGDARLAAVAPSVLYEAAEIQPSAESAAMTDTCCRTDTHLKKKKKHVHTHTRARCRLTVLDGDVDRTQEITCQPDIFASGGAGRRGWERGDRYKSLSLVEGSDFIPRRLLARRQGQLLCFAAD